MITIIRRIFDGSNLLAARGKSAGDSRFSGAGGVAALQSGRDAIFGAFPFSFAEVEWSAPLRSQRDFQPPYQLHFIFLAIIHPFLSFDLLEKQKIYQ